MDNIEQEQTTALVAAESETSLATESTSIDLEKLRAESTKILSQLVAEQDADKAKDLTYLFNQNQNKKTAIRVNKLNELLDVIADHTMVRFLTHPDEISNKELLDSLKIIQDLALSGQRQVTEAIETPAPLIQFNQQNNEVNLDGKPQGNLSRDSREKVKSVVESLLKGLVNMPATTAATTDTKELDPELELHEESEDFETDEEEINNG